MLDLRPSPGGTQQGVQAPRGSREKSTSSPRGRHVHGLKIRPIAIGEAILRLAERAYCLHTNHDQALQNGVLSDIIGLFLETNPWN